MQGLSWLEVQAAASHDRQDPVTRILAPMSTPQQRLPKDVLQKVAQLFPDPAEKKEVLEALSKLYDRPLNVGAAQLARSVLVVTDGDFDAFRTMIQDLGGDPRDVIVEAEGKLGNPGHAFNTPFED